MSKKPLINGRLMTCPRCKRDHDILQYMRLEMIEEFELETTPIYKCPSCKWMFAPAHEMPQDLIRRFEELLAKLEDKEVSTA